MLSFLKASLTGAQSFLQQSSRWPVGYVMIAGVVVARWLGLFATLELAVLDVFLRSRPAAGIDEQVVIVLIEQDPVRVDENLSESQLAQLLEIILSAEPAVVGLNVFREEFSDDPGREQLLDLFETHENLITVEKVLPPRPIPPIAPLSDRVAQTQVGLNDVPLDRDGRIRRVFVGAYLPDENEDATDNPFRFSFSFKLAETYLTTQRGYVLENHPTNPDIPIFKEPESLEFMPIPILEENSGGYVREADISKLQTLLNFRSGSATFEVVEASQLVDRSQDLEALTDKVVIVDEIDAYFPRFLPVSASSNLMQDYETRDISPRIGITGPELEAHATSQIIRSVIDARPLIRGISFWGEDILIVSAGLMGIAMSISFRSTLRSMISLAVVTLIAVGACYLILSRFGLWLPVAPMAMSLPLAGITYLGFNYRSQRSALRNQEAALVEVQVLEAERRKAIERAFSAIHAGPLQRLSSLLRSAKDGNTEQSFVLEELRALNQEIRGVGERLRQEAIGDVYFFYSQGDIKLDLTHPMHEVLYEVYSLAVKRKLPGFETIKVRAVSIEPFNCKQLNLDVKRQLCWFLEESLQNIGKHALGTTRIQVLGKNINDFYSLKIEDNGPGIQSTHIGDGTQSSYRLELMLSGKFSRFSKRDGNGTVCELSWPSSQ
ncbi:MAG: CHASE2 domain-containing protein [Cyanobacteria bacterium J06626_4]